MRNPFAQGVLLILIAVVLAFAANAVASRPRRLVLPGWYPDAQRVPVGTPALPPVRPPATPPLTAPAAAATPPPTSPAPARPSAPAPVPADPLARYRPHPDKPYVDIGGDEVAALYKAGVLFLDARRTSVYDEGHIKGARPFSVWESDIDEKVKKLFDERGDPQEQARPIVIYCSGGECQDSHMLAQKLWGIQFNNIYVYKDGFPDWLRRGGAVAKSN